MEWLKLISRKIKGSRHENHTSHTQKSSKSNKTDTTYRSAASNDGFSRGRQQDPHHVKRAQLPHRSENRNGNSDQTRHIYKRPYSVEERIKYIGDYIDYWNKSNPHDQVKIDIIVLGGLLDNNQNLTEPRSGSKVEFICKPEKPWDKLSSEKLQRACTKLKWHTNDLWYPCAMDPGVRKKMFEVIGNDEVHKSKMEGLIIRKPPPEYRICQRIDRLGGRESNPELYDTKLSEIVEDIEGYINKHKQQLEGIRSKSKKGVTPRELIKKWQKEYDFEFGDVLLSPKNKKVDGSKPREKSGTRIRHGTHRGDGRHDSAVSISPDQRPASKSRAYNSSNHGSESDTSTSKHPRRVNEQIVQRAPKPRAQKPSGYVSDSSTSTRPRRRTQDPSQPLLQSNPPTKSNRNNLAKNAPRSRPSITIHSPSEDRGRSPGKSPNRRPPGRSPRTPRTPQTPVNKNYQNPGKSPLPPPFYPSDHGRQKSPARPGSGSRGRMIPKRSHPELLHPSTSQPQSNSYPHANSYEMRSRENNTDLVNKNPHHSQQQPHSNSQLNSPYVNRKYGYLRPSNEDSEPTSPVKPNDMLWKNGKTPEQIEEIHRKWYEKLRSEDGNSEMVIDHES